MGGNGVQFERAAGGKRCSEHCHAAQCVSSRLRIRLLRPFLSLSFVHVTLRVTSSQLEQVAVCRLFVWQCEAEFFR